MAKTLRLGVAGLGTVGSGVLDFSVSTLSQGRGQIQWDGATDQTTAIDFTGLSGADMTNGGTLNAFALDIVFSDGGFNFEVTAYSSATSWTSISFVSAAHPVPSTTTISFAAFMNPLLCGVPNPAPGVLLISCGATVANFTIATTESYKDKTTGEKKISRNGITSYCGAGWPI